MSSCPCESSIPKQYPIYSLHCESDGHCLKDHKGKSRHSLNASAAAVWELCSGHFTVGDIIEIMMTGFPQSENTIAEDVLSVLNDLRERNTLYFSDLDGTEISLSTEFSTGRQLSADPLIVVFDNFLSDDECDLFIEYAKPRLERAEVIDGGKHVVSDMRTNQLAHMKITGDSFQKTVIERAAKLIGLPPEKCGSLSILHYGIGEEYKTHSDCFRMKDESELKLAGKGGQRLATFLIYLNTVEAGGETRFPHLDTAMPAVRGRAVLFHDCFPGTVIMDPRSNHHATPVIRGEKWAVPLWFREYAVR